MILEGEDANVAFRTIQLNFMPAADPQQHINVDRLTFVTIPTKVSALVTTLGFYRQDSSKLIQGLLVTSYR
jgi:hypothetical protein